MIVNYVINSIFTNRSKHFSLFCILQPPPKKKKKNFSKKRTKELCVSDIDEILELVFLSEN